MNLRKQSNPLKRRRISLGITQKKISELLNITQSQYSKIESGDTDPTKYLNSLSQILDCKPNEIFMGEILNEIEDEFLNDPIKEMSTTYHQSKPNSVYIKMEGWFTQKELEDFVEFSKSGFKDGNS
jgi:transcriptional regulator with XRE-family HTH domain